MRIQYYLIWWGFCLTQTVSSCDLLLEFKAGYFLPIAHNFRDIIGRGGALYGPELTFRIHDQWYGWVGIDFFTKKHLAPNFAASGATVSEGCCMLRCNGTYEKALFIPLSTGLKYCLPFMESAHDNRGEFYLGLGIEPTYLKVKGADPYSDWGIGGITQLGTYFTFPRNVFIDIFFEYSFAWVFHKKKTIDVSGCVFGAGIGYRF